MTSKIPNWYKASPLWPIPQEWGFEKLNSLCSISWEYWINAPAVEYSADLPHYLRITDIQNGKLSLKKKKSVITDEMEKYTLSEWDVVFARTWGTVWITYIHSWKKRLVFAWFLVRFRTHPHILLPYYLKLYTETWRYRNWIKVMSVRSWQPWVNWKEYWSLAFPLPPLSEQKAIASILSDCDDTITQTQQLIENLELRHKALCQQLLTGKKRVSWFDEKVEKKYIHSFATQLSNKNKANKELIVLSCTKYNGLVSSLEYFWRKMYSDDLSKYKIVPKKTFAYATNHIEEWSIGYQEEYDEALISPMYTIFETDDSINDYYLYMVLKSHELIHEYNRRMTGSIDRRWWLRRNEFSKIKVYIPEIIEQNAILDILKSSKDHILQAEQKLIGLKKTKKWLMQQLLTGKIRVPESYLEA